MNKQLLIACVGFVFFGMLYGSFYDPNRTWSEYLNPISRQKLDENPIKYRPFGWNARVQVFPNRMVSSDAYNIEFDTLGKGYTVMALYLVGKALYNWLRGPLHHFKNKIDAQIKNNNAIIEYAQNLLEKKVSSEQMKDLITDVKVLSEESNKKLNTLFQRIKYQEGFAKESIQKSDRKNKKLENKLKSIR